VEIPGQDGNAIEEVIVMTRTKAISLSGVMVVSVLLSACSTPTWTSPPGTQTFQVGYRDGCDAGYAVAGSPFYERIENAEPGSQDGEYVNGWHEGYLDCKRSYDRMQATIHSFFSTL
jgi:hypothetical protein